MTPCDFEVLIGPYHDRELEEDRAAEMAKHTLDCPACAGHLAELRRLSGVIGRVPLDPLSGIERARLYRHLDVLPQRLAEQTLFRIAGSLAAIAASLLLVTSLCLMGASRPAGAPQAVQPIAVVLPHANVWSDQANANLSHWMVRNLGGDLP